MQLISILPQCRFKTPFITDSPYVHEIAHHKEPINKGEHLLYSLLLLILILCSCQSNGQDLVHDIDAFNKAVEQAQPGDQITLANGVWKDVELLFVGKGTKENPIILTVQEKGKVTLEGQSNIRIAGEHLHVEGLVFKNGYGPTSEVISLKKNKEKLCTDCRITECVIDNYNPPERFDTDYWIGIYGRNNRIDHNYLVGKRNQGVTMAIRLNTEESRENNHRIDHNYFGHRPILGSNGGETLRIGTSHYSLTNSKTLVENNYFDRCSGELEIISSKSCQNTFRGNTFFECQGTLTMRHGNETVVEDNYFFGNRKPNTGGIRIINETQTVRNNYHEGLTGYRLRGAFVIMNGVPNSPANRYLQVINSTASNNTYLDCDHVQLCAGSDEERSATPKNTTVNSNIFYNRNRESIFTIYDDISGITFEDNLLSPNLKSISKEGFANKEIDFKRNESGLLVPSEVLEAGMHPNGEMATPENTGVAWYDRVEQEPIFSKGKTIKIKSGENTLLSAIEKSEDGDIIELEESGEYLMTKSIDLYHTITFQAARELTSKPVIKFQKSSLFNIENGGSLTLSGLKFDGGECPDYSGNSVIRTSRYSMNRNYKLFVENCDFMDLDVNHSFEVLKVFKNTFADSIVLRNSSFTKISGSVLALDKETEDKGIYNAENVIIENCQFKDIGGAVLILYRGGTDESTSGPMLKMDQCQLANVGQDNRNKIGASIAMHGVQKANIENNRFEDSEPIKLHMVVGDPITNIVDCTFLNTPTIIANEEPYHTKNLVFK
ncbi:UNVERIFIED_CONTAM: hypothetical protein GTU68_048566 [Idotea baltica]|nr:hypothetical protein [Idotea baltica]